MSTDPIKTLADRIAKAKDAYYNGAPIMSDAEYDALEDELRKLDPSHPVLAKVGAAPSGGWVKVKHSIPMGSLNKAQTLPELNAWASGCGLTSGLLVTEKLDGISLGLRYEQRKLVQGLTRGDGETGEDVTRNILLMKGAVKMLPATLPDGTPTPDLVFVRGEVVCLKSDFAAHFPGESNPRNTASGTSKRQSDPAKCRFLTIKAYQFLPDGRAPGSKQAEMTALTDLGFQTPNWQVCSTLADVEKLYQGYIDSTRDGLDYDIDGLVVEADDTATRDGLGEKNHRPAGAIAFKFLAEEKPTILRDIVWQVGKSGRVTPVAHFDPVQLTGAVVRKASLAGVRQVQHLRLYAGCTILVARRNDVIPRVEANVSEGILNDI